VGRHYDSFRSPTPTPIGVKEVPYPWDGAFSLVPDSRCSVTLFPAYTVTRLLVGFHTPVALLRPGVMIKAEDHRAAEEAGDRYESCHDKQRNPEADPGPTAVWMATQFAQQ
jgi:hypothetical protein